MDTNALFSKVPARRRRRLSALVIVAALGVAACGSDNADSTSDDNSTEEAAAGLTITEPWSRQPAAGQSVAAVYGVVTNATDAAVTAIAASSPSSAVVELHQVTMNEDGQMSMGEKPGGYKIGAGESLVFEPGGPHIMLLDIDAASYPKMVDMTLEFDNGETIEFMAEVRSITADAMDEMDMDEMDHSGHGNQGMDMDG